MKYVLWIGMNPSTARADVDDPTVRREQDFTRAWGYTSYIKANVCDYRATNPRTLTAPGIRPCSHENFTQIRKLARRASLIVVCYGVLPKKLQHLADDLVEQLRDDAKHLNYVGDRGLWCLGKTKDGHPKHPLYLPKTTKLVRF